MARILKSSWSVMESRCSTGLFCCRCMPNHCLASGRGFECGLVVSLIVLVDVGLKGHILPPFLSLPLIYFYLLVLNVPVLIIFFLGNLSWASWDGIRSAWVARLNREWIVS
jgi:hypothetical protein